MYGILWDGVDKAKYMGYVMEYVEGGNLHGGLILPAVECSSRTH